MKPPPMLIEPIAIASACHGTDLADQTSGAADEHAGLGESAGAAAGAGLRG